MPQLIYTAARSEAKVNEETIDGLQAIDYRVVRNRHDVGRRRAPTSGSPSTTG